MKYEKRYLYYSILPCCLLLIVIGIYAFGYNPPTCDPPGCNLPAPINAGPNSQTKEGDLTVEGNFTTKGILKLGQFTNADLPAGVEGALCFNTTKNIVQIYTLGSWRDLTTTKLGLGETCSLDGDCDSVNCVDGYCCNASCEGTCNRCNVAGSLGSCIATPSDCAGGCSICSSGNCIADPTKCTGNCVQCTGSGTNYSCSANLSVCTGNCSFCNGSGTEYNCVGSNGFCTGNCDVCSGSGTAYSCAASNALCSNTTASCGCSGSGTVFNCTTCTSDPYGVCGHPICSSYTCSQAYDNGATCATCKTCSNGACTSFTAIGAQDASCNGCSYCSGGGGCALCRWEKYGLMSGLDTVATRKCTWASIGILAIAGGAANGPCDGNFWSYATGGSYTWEMSKCNCY